MPKKQRKPVVVVSAPSSFPDFSQFGGSSAKSKRKNQQQESTSKKGIEIDFDNTAREIHKLGSTQFIGKQKKQYEAEQYKALTGREKKQHKVPVKIVRGIKKAAAKREARIMKEMKDAGIVTANVAKKEKRTYSEQNRRDTRIHGPSPSAGFMMKGVLNVKRM